MTKLTGRYIEFEMMPLSFEEYLDMKKFLDIPLLANLTEELDLFLMGEGISKDVVL